jgi:GntR family transcriptional repressor for pyruvate dehydrogenase complex
VRSPRGRTSRITDAIRAGDEAAAMRRMARHVCGFARAAAEVDVRERVELADPES